MSLEIDDRRVRLEDTSVGIRISLEIDERNHVS